jgi:hypothetical protein
LGNHCLAPLFLIYDFLPTLSPLYYFCP